MGGSNSWTKQQPKDIDSHFDQPIVLKYRLRLTSDQKKFGDFQILGSSPVHTMANLYRSGDTCKIDTESTSYTLIQDWWITAKAPKVCTVVLSFSTTTRSTSFYDSIWTWGAAWLDTFSISMWTKAVKRKVFSGVLYYIGRTIWAFDHTGIVKTSSQYHRNDYSEAVRQHWKQRHCLCYVPLRHITWQYMSRRHKQWHNSCSNNRQVQRSVLSAPMEVLRVIATWPL